MTSFHVLSSFHSEKFKSMDVRLQTPFSLLCCGPSGSGKTQWTKRLLENTEEMMTNIPDRIVWCYGEYQPAYQALSQQFPQIEFIEGIPSEVNEMFDSKMNNMIIIDDLMAEAASDKKICNLFTKGSHHRNLSVIFILQNLFYQGKESRTISLNSHYIVLFKNPRDRSQIVHLAKQMFPNNIKFLQESYADATSKPFGYLFLDFKPNCPDNMRVRTNIFPLETPHFVYVQKK